MIEDLVIRPLEEERKPESDDERKSDEPGFAAGFALGLARFDAGLAVASSNARSCAS